MRSLVLSRAQRIEIRVISAANAFIMDPFATTRSVAKELGVSKTTIHRYLRDLLPEIDIGLSAKVANKLSNNLDARASRGGRATAKKRANKL